MHLAPLAILLLGLATAPVAAGDFTGFYAGVNAGYAFGRDGERLPGPAVTPDPGRAASDDALPPSARSAADVLVGQRERAHRPGRSQR